MADSLSVTLQFMLQGTWLDTQDMGQIFDTPVFNLGDTLADGTNVIDCADQWWHDERTVTAAAETLDLTALTRTVYGSVATINMARVKGLLIYNTNLSAANKLTVGAAATNP